MGSRDVVDPAQRSDRDDCLREAGKGETVKRTLFSLVLLLGLVLPATSAVMAQPTVADQTFVTELTGDEVDLGTSGDITFIEENYDLRETASFQEEYVWFTYGWSNFQLVMIGGPIEAADYHDVTLGNMEDFYDSWELIDEDITDERTWFLGEGEVSGGSLIVYYEFELDAFGDIDQAFMQFTDISAFQSDLEFVQDEVTIGGAPLLPETDAAELVTLVGGDVASPETTPDADDDNDSETGRSRSSRGGSEATNDADEDADNGVSRTSRGGSDPANETEEDDSDTGTSRTSRGGTDSDDETDEDNESTSRTSRTSRGGTDDDDADVTNDVNTGGNSRVGRLGDTLNNPSDEEDEVSTPVAGADWDDMGLISDSEWESPSHGNVVTWDAATWEFPLDYEHAIVVNEDPAYDIITLQTTDGLGYVYITVDLQYESTPTSLIEYWTSDDYSAQITNGVTVVETGTTATSATLVYETTNTIDQPLVVVLEATFLEDGGIIFSQISGAPETIGEVYEQFVDDVEFDGAPIETTFTVEDILDITGN